MTWISHKLLTGAILFSLSGDLVISSFGAIGAIIPDAIEGFPDPTSETAQTNWRRNHRQASHYAPFYLAIFMITWIFLYIHGITRIEMDTIIPLFHSDFFWPVIATYILSFVALGAVFHILEDAVCGTVPGFTIRARWGIRLIKVGSIYEYVSIIPISILLIAPRIISLYK